MGKWKACQWKDLIWYYDIYCNLEVFLLFQGMLGLIIYFLLLQRERVCIIWLLSMNTIWFMLCWVVWCKMFVNIFIILSSPTKKLSANRNNNYHFSNLFINSVPIQNFIIYQTNTKIFLSFYTRKEQIINYKPPQQSKQSKCCHFHLLDW